MIPNDFVADLSSGRLFFGNAAGLAFPSERQCQDGLA